jgi:hypothetical protein
MDIARWLFENRDGSVNRSIRMNLLLWKQAPTYESQYWEVYYVYTPWLSSNPHQKIVSNTYLVNQSS